MRLANGTFFFLTLAIQFSLGAMPQYQNLIESVRYELDQSIYKFICIDNVLSDRKGTCSSLFFEDLGLSIYLDDDRLDDDQRLLYMIAYKGFREDFDSPQKDGQVDTDLVIEISQNINNDVKKMASFMLESEDCSTILNFKFSKIDFPFITERRNKILDWLFITKPFCERIATLESLIKNGKLSSESEKVKMVNELDEQLGLIVDWAEKMADTFDSKEHIDIFRNEEKVMMYYFDNLITYSVFKQTYFAWLWFFLYWFLLSTTVANVLATAFNSFLDTMTKEKGSKYDLRNSRFAGGFAENVRRDQIGTQYNTLEDQEGLAEVAAELQKLLEHLSQTYPTLTTADKLVIASTVVKQVESSPTLMPRVLSALKVGGVSALEQFLEHPAASFVINALDDFQKSRGE